MADTGILIYIYIYILSVYIKLQFWVRGGVVLEVR